ncbi:MULTISPECIES: DUF6477 family protein [Roseobacteraceae]|nr:MULTISPECIES: DUF6477 family protein [Roseobacteraceae]MCJ7873811.1 DUF6477 family protein [Phaeobacter sp. J2-8]
MQDALSLLSQLRRPRLLIRAARAGLIDYRRDLHLQRAMGGSTPRRSGPALIKLLEMEHELNDARVERSASYDVARHVEIMIAMMGEAALIRAAR